VAEERLVRGRGRGRGRVSVRVSDRIGIGIGIGIGLGRGGLGLRLGAEARRDGIDVGRDQRGGLPAEYGHHTLTHAGVRVGQHLVGCMS